MAKAKAKTSADTAANLGFEAKLWLMANKLRNNMDAAEYKHVVLAMIFLKYICDAFEERHQKLVERLAPYKGRVYDPYCGSAGMFVQSEEFIEEYSLRWRTRKILHAAVPERQFRKVSGQGCQDNSHREGPQGQK